MYLLFLLIPVLFNTTSNAQNVSNDSVTDSSFVKKEKPQLVSREKGFFNNTQVGIGVRMGLPVITISTVNGYQFSRHISLGLGIGYIRMHYPLWSWRHLFSLGKVEKSKTAATVNQINIFIEQRFSLGDQKVSPFLFYDLGYSFCIPPADHELTKEEKSEYLSTDYHYDTLVKTSYTAGVYFAPGVGLRVLLHQNISLNFSLQLYIAMYSINSTYRNNGYENYVPGGIKMNLYPVFNVGIGF